MDMPIPHSKTISFPDYQFQDGQDSITVSYEFTEGTKANIWPLGGGDSIEIIGPSGSLTLPVGRFRKWTLETPDSTTTVLFQPL